MLAIQRHERILAYLTDRKSAKIDELSDSLGASLSTMRRDLAQLEAEGHLRRVHGGAVLCAENNENESPLTQRAALHSDEKRRIGEAAAQLVHDGETIIITSGSTTEAMLPFLRSKANLTVITNALNIAHRLTFYPQISVVVLGGWLRHSGTSLLGHLTECALQDLRADRLFHGIFGLHPKHGLTGTFVPEVQTDRNIIASASQFVVLADHSKFGIEGPVRVAPLAGVSLIITDKQAPAGDVAALRAQGIDVLET